MAAPAAPADPTSGNIWVCRLTEANRDELLPKALQAMTIGWQDEITMTRFPMSPEEVHATHMSYLGPACTKDSGGHIFVSGSEEGVVESVAVWMESGRTTTDTKEKQAFKDALAAVTSDTRKTWNKQEGGASAITAARDAVFPNLWRNSHHLHVIVTVPSGRGKGLGGALMHVAHAHLGGINGSALCSLSTYSEAKASFYAKFGYTEVWRSVKIYPNKAKEPYIVMTRPTCT